jgi:hypothetical protein
LARDALGQASPETAEARGPAPELQGAVRDAEIGRLAEIFPEPAPQAQGAPAPPDYYRSAPGSAEHRDAYRHMLAMVTSHSSGPHCSVVGNDFAQRVCHSPVLQHPLDVKIELTHQPDPFVPGD